MSVEEGEIMEGEATTIEVEDLPTLPVEFKDQRKVERLRKVSVESMSNFLSNLRATGLVYKSCDLAGLAYTTINRLRKESDDFRELMEEAMEAYRNLLQAEAHRRAIEGWDEPVFSQRLGNQIGTVRKFDTRLHELLLKRHIPEFREKFEGEIKVSGGVLVAPVSAPNEEDWVKKFGERKLNLLTDEASGTSSPEEGEPNDDQT